MEDKEEADKKVDIETRLKEATELCLKCHGEWSKNQKDGAIRGNLMEAVHELRKVAARLEIEIAISERNEMTSKPIPIPSHRSNKRQYHDNNSEDNRGNTDGGNRSGGRSKPSGSSRPPRRKAGGSAPKSSG